MPVIDGAAVVLQREREREREGGGSKRGGEREKKRGEGELSSGHCDWKAPISSNHPSGDQLNIFLILKVRTELKS